MRQVGGIELLLSDEPALRNHTDLQLPVFQDGLVSVIFPAMPMGLLTFQFRELLSRKWVKNKTPAEAEGRRYTWHSQGPAVLEHVASVKNGGW